MNKQMKAAMAAMMLIGTLPLQAQQSETKVVKVAPGQKKTTVIHRKNGATDTVVSEGASTGTHHAHHRTTHRTRHTSGAVQVESATTRELRELREKQAAQQAEIDSLTAAGAAKDAAIAQAQSATAAASAQAQQATSQAQSVTTTVQANSDAVQKLQSNVSDLQTTNAGLANTIIANKAELTEKIDSPLALHYKGITITPVAFLAFEGVFRQHALNSDINTPFNTIPYPGSSEAHVSELNFTGRQSRLGGLFEGNTGSVKLSGYFETDFLSAASTSNSNQSNSYSLRVRQIWGKAETKSGFAVTGGQTWSLVTEDGRSTDARTEKLPNTIDSQYMVGFSWARQPTIRLQQRFGQKFFGSAVTLAVAAEQAQIQSFNATNAPANFFFGGAGVGGGLFAPTANYTNNVAPDGVAKLAFDFPHSHFEIGGVVRAFRDRIFPSIAITNTTPGSVANAALQPYNSTALGGGGFASARVSFGKYMDIAAQGMVGDGTGRYGSAQLVDVTVRPNGTLEPIRNAHGLGGIETHPTPKLDVYAYYGGEYAQRTQYATGVTIPTGTVAAPSTFAQQQVAFTGYGTINNNLTGCENELAAIPAPGAGGFGGVDTTNGTCQAVTKYIFEGMAGFTYKIINSPKYGRLQYQATYSYIGKNSWTGITGGTPLAPTSFGRAKAVENMVHFGMRYYIP